ncbi:MAG: hypothetical protein R3315_02655 [Woeseiaceae bacterium]|nr:hypothetical protein [Woeseiaceae bacterium]
MAAITEQSTVEEVAAIVSEALENAGVTATLSGGSVVTIYSKNEYLSRDLDFVTSAMLSDLKPVMEGLGFEHTGVPRLSQFSHPKVEWYVEFPPSPLSFGQLHVKPEDCAVLALPVGRLRIITPTQSVMDRLAAAYAWKDAQSRDQALMVAANQDIDWEALRDWFANEGETTDEWRRFQDAVNAKRSGRVDT